MDILLFENSDRKSYHMIKPETIHPKRFQVNKYEIIIPNLVDFFLSIISFNKPSIFAKITTYH